MQVKYNRLHLNDLTSRCLWASPHGGCVDCALSVRRGGCFEKRGKKKKERQGGGRRELACSRLENGRHLLRSQSAVAKRTRGGRFPPFFYSFTTKSILHFPPLRFKTAIIHQCPLIELYSYTMLYNVTLDFVHHLNNLSENER